VRDPVPKLKRPDDGALFCASVRKLSPCYDRLLPRYGVLTSGRNRQGDFVIRTIRTAFAGSFLISTLALAAATPELPPPTGFLFWTPAQQRIGYRNIEKIFPTRTVKRGAKVARLPTDAA